jgi:hypothetical protein
MSSESVTRRNGEEISDQWWKTFTDATFRLVDVKREDPVHSRSRHGWQVCLVRWMECCFEEPVQFYEALKAGMPLDTKIFGCKDFDRYFAVVAFPYSFVSWKGLKEHFCLSHKDGKKDTAMVDFYVLQEGNGVGEWIEWMHLFCKTSSFVFGEEFVEEDLKANEYGVVLVAGGMWTIVEI